MKDIKESILDSVSRDNGFNNWIHAGIMKEPVELTPIIHEAMEKYSHHELGKITKPQHFSIHRESIKNIILGHRGVRTRDVHWDECLYALAIYAVKCEIKIKP